MPISDLLAGMYGAYGVLAALLERERTGEGTVVRTSLLAATVGVHAFQGTRWTVAGEVGRAQGNHHASIAPYGLFHCADGTVQIALGSEALWRRFCAGFDLDPATPGLETNSDAGRPPRADHRVRGGGVRGLEGRGRCWPGSPRSASPRARCGTMDEVYAWDQVASQGLTIDVEHATLGDVTLPGPPLRFFDRSGDEVTRDRAHRAADPRRARRRRAGVAGSAEELSRAGSAGRAPAPVDDQGQRVQRRPAERHAEHLLAGLVVCRPRRPGSARRRRRRRSGSAIAAVIVFGDRPKQADAC